MRYLTIAHYGTEEFSESFVQYDDLTSLVKVESKFLEDEDKNKRSTEVYIYELTKIMKPKRTVFEAEIMDYLPESNVKSEIEI